MNTAVAYRIALLSLSVCAALFCGGCPRCDCDTGDGNAANVQMTPFSGRFGYGLSGPFGFLGTLTKEQITDEAWRLEGNFAFPTGGYTVGTPVILVAESYPEQVSVTIPVTAPAPGSIVTQAISVVPVTADITASNGARFSIRITGGGTLPCPDAVQVTVKNEKDAWTLEAGATAPRIVIDCPSGIGEATIRFDESCPLRKLLVGLRYGPNQPFTKLEDFDASSEAGGPVRSFSACSCPGFIQVALPESALNPANGTLTIRWVDLYR